MPITLFQEILRGLSDVAFCTALEKWRDKRAADKAAEEEEITIPPIPYVIMDEGVDFAEIRRRDAVEEEKLKTEKNRE